MLIMKNTCSTDVAHSCGFASMIDANVVAEMEECAQPPNATSINCNIESESLAAKSQAVYIDTGDGISNYSQTYDTCIRILEFSEKIPGLRWESNPHLHNSGVMLYLSLIHI